MTRTSPLAHALHRDATALLEAYHTGAWTPEPAEQDLASALARAHWDPHLLRTALRDIPPSVRSGRLIDILAPAADLLSSAGTPNPVPQLRPLIDALAD